MSTSSRPGARAPGRPGLSAPGAAAVHAGAGSRPPDAAVSAPGARSAATPCPAPHGPARLRRRPTGAPPPLPRKLGTSGKAWLGLAGLLAVALVAFVLRGQPLVAAQAGDLGPPLDRLAPDRLAHPRHARPRRGRHRLVETHPRRGHPRPPDRLQALAAPVHVLRQPARRGDPRPPRLPARAARAPVRRHHHRRLDRVRGALVPDPHPRDRPRRVHVLDGGAGPAPRMGEARRSPW